MANSSNKKLVPEDGYNGDISAKDAGKIGGQMVKKMIEQAERNMK